MTLRLLFASALFAFQLPAAQGIPTPGPATGSPYAPQSIVAGGIVMPLYPPDSPFLKKERITEPEVYNMQASVPGRIQSIVNIHNPSIEIHPVEKGINTELVDDNRRKAVDLLDIPAPPANRGGPAAGSTASVVEIRTLLQNASAKK